jgi:hypothetical protein
LRRSGGQELRGFRTLLHVLNERYETCRSALAGTSRHAVFRHASDSLMVRRLGMAIASAANASNDAHPMHINMPRPKAEMNQCHQN